MTEQHLQEREQLDAIIKQMVETDCEYFNHVQLSGGLNLAYRIVKHACGDGPMPWKLHRGLIEACLLYTSPSPRDATLSRMPSSA